MSGMAAFSNKDYSVLACQERPDSIEIIHEMSSGEGGDSIYYPCNNKAPKLGFKKVPVSEASYRDVRSSHQVDYNYQDR